MRAAFIASLAAVSMGGYIAGVGDRHMDNYLVDLSSGALVPIDFGYALPCPCPAPALPLPCPALPCPLLVLVQAELV